MRTFNETFHRVSTEVEELQAMFKIDCMIAVLIYQQKLVSHYKLAARSISWFTPLTRHHDRYYAVLTLQSSKHSPPSSVLVQLRCAEHQIMHDPLKHLRQAEKLLAPAQENEDH